MDGAHREAFERSGAGVGDGHGDKSVEDMEFAIEAQTRLLTQQAAA